MANFARMELFNPALLSYLDKNCDPEPVLLAQISRETYLREPQAHMLSGHYQGRVLALLSKLLSPKRILEIGTFTGYATLCLAEGLRANGELHTIDINEELEDRVRDYFGKSGYGECIHYHIGDAVAIIPEMPGFFDLVFIDADKRNNLFYLQLMIDKTRAGSLILIDNVLWKGRVLSGEPDRQTKQVLELNDYIARETRFEKLLLPIRDGLYILRRK